MKVLRIIKTNIKPILDPGFRCEYSGKWDCGVGSLPRSFNSNEAVIERLETHPIRKLHSMSYARLENQGLSYYDESASLYVRSGQVESSENLS